MTTRIFSCLNDTARRTHTRKATFVIVSILFSTIFGVSLDAECLPNGPDTTLNVKDMWDQALVEAKTIRSNPKAPSQLPSTGHNKPIERKDEDDEKNEKDTEFDPALKEYTDWKTTNGDTFLGDQGQYLTSKGADGGDMLFHSNDGGKTYYPVKNGSYQISNGEVSLQKGFNPNAPGAVEGRVAGGGGDIANTVPQASDPALNGASNTRPSQTSHSGAGGHWVERHTKCSRAGKCGPTLVWVPH